jgi:hypothetical protein
MDFREGQLVKTSTNRLGRTKILTPSKPCRRSGSMATIRGKERRYACTGTAVRVAPGCLTHDRTTKPGVRWRQLQGVEKVTPCHRHGNRASGELSSVEM